VRLASQLTSSYNEMQSVSLFLMIFARALSSPVMTGPFPSCTILNFPNCALPDPTPGTSDEFCTVNSTLPSAELCAAACLASASCTSYTWHADDPVNGPWALACVFRLDGAWEPEYDAAAHACGEKVEPAPPLVWPVSDGFNKLPVMWFGSNVSGLDAHDTLALIARHRVGVYGWQQGTGALVPGQNLGEGDVFLAEAATHLSDYLDEVGAAGLNRTLVGVYRQVQVALRLFAAPRAAADNSANTDFWMRDNDGVICAVAQPWGTTDPFWNFSNFRASNYWVDQVVSDVAAEAPAGVRTVFFDESDQNFCGYWSEPQGNCGSFSLTSLAPMHAANNALLARTAATLNAAGIIPIFSMLNRMAASGAGLNIADPCALPEDVTLAALNNTVAARFYENFPFSWWAPGVSGPDGAAALVENAILEGIAGLPLVLHFDVTSCPSTPRNITRPGRMGGGVEVELALFLVVQTEQTVFSISGNWYDADFCWRSEFDIEFGHPLAPANRMGPYAWTRNFTKSWVAVDVQAGTGEVWLL
jgi:hypothetical protein